MTEETFEQFWNILGRLHSHIREVGVQFDVLSTKIDELREGFRSMTAFLHALEDATSEETPSP